MTEPTPGQLRLVAAQRERRLRKHRRWAAEMRAAGWLAVEPDASERRLAALRSVSAMLIERENAITRTEYDHLVRQESA